MYANMISKDEYCWAIELSKHRARLAGCSDNSLPAFNIIGWLHLSRFVPTLPKGGRRNAGKAKMSCSTLLRAAGKGQVRRGLSEEAMHRGAFFGVSWNLSLRGFKGGDLVCLLSCRFPPAASAPSQRVCVLPGRSVTLSWYIEILPVGA